LNRYQLKSQHSNQSEGKASELERKLTKEESNTVSVNHNALHEEHVSKLENDDSSIASFGSPLSEPKISSKYTGASDATNSSNSDRESPSELKLENMVEANPTFSECEVSRDC
jgi:hypothetical protein